MGGGASIPTPGGKFDGEAPTQEPPKRRKKASAAEIAGSEAIIAILEDDSIPDVAAAEKVRLVKKIDPYWRMNLLKHDEEGWGLLHIAVSARVHEERLACLGALLERSGKQK
eukprot:COSAG05_NODE_13340_length_434_cov_0.611940_1_plen_111_part_10